MQPLTRLVWFAFSALAAGSIVAEAQVRQIPGTLVARLSKVCQSIERGESATLSIGDARVRRGGSVRTTGMRQSVVVEEGATAEIHGTASYIYVARGGNATIGGARNQIVAEQGGNVSIVGSAILTIVDGIDVEVNQYAPNCR